jgi:porphobilinogen synthase
MSFPWTRLRRLRENKQLREMLSEHRLYAKELIQPLFIKEGLSKPVPIASMPGQSQFSVASAVREAQSLESLGVSAVLLFGIPAKKDTQGRQAFLKNGIVQKAVREIKRKCKELLVITDVCLCEYMSHGHCGHVNGGRIVNDTSVKTLAGAALSHAEAGADIVAPSDMMDGRVRAIRQKLDRGGFQSLPILSYAVKYASAYYAPFRDAAESAPRFGDRRSYQMNSANRREALREAKTDLEEGADMLLVKPALGYADILFDIKQRFHAPTGAYAVSGEYSMIKAAAQKGWLDEKNTVLESHLSLKRAGADFIVTYWAKDLQKWLKK